MNADRPIADVGPMRQSVTSRLGLLPAWDNSRHRRQLIRLSVRRAADGAAAESRAWTKDSRHINHRNMTHQRRHHSPRRRRCCGDCSGSASIRETGGRL